MIIKKFREVIKRLKRQFKPCEMITLCEGYVENGGKFYVFRDVLDDAEKRDGN